MKKIILIIKLLSICILVVWLPLQTLWGQINTEILRSVKPNLGYYHTINLEMQINKGNSEMFRMKTSYRVDFIDSTNRAFAIISYENANSLDKQIINKGFIHLRFMQNFNQPLEYEYYYQKEFNEFTRLLDRNILGGNIRFNIFNINEPSTQLKLSIGSGAMFENESVKQAYNWQTNEFKFNEYLSLFFKINENVTLSSIFYYQIAMMNFSDKRYLSNSTLFFKINKNLRLSSSLNMYYNSLPPDGVKPFDLDFMNGIIIDL